VGPQVVHASGHQVVQLALVPLVQRRQRHRAQHHCRGQRQAAN
jgi:hypothetical protein